MDKWRYLYLFFIIVGLAACKNEDDTTTEKLTDSLYFDYSVIAEEGREMVSCLFRFREGGLDGDPVTLSETVMLTFDGLEIAADSARMAGTFYEIMLPLNQFEGEHTVLFRAPSGREYTETFYFQPFSLKNEVPANISRKNFNLELDGLAENDRIAIIMTDTAFLSNDLNRLDTVQNGMLSIPPEKLTEVTNGPVVLQLHKEENKKLKQSPREGGRLLISYGLQREFVLTD